MADCTGLKQHINKKHIMKKIISFLILSFSFWCVAQDKAIVSDWTAVAQSINVQDKQNWKFRVSAKIRKENDNNAKCAIWVRIDKLDNTIGFFENQAYSNIKVTSEWKTFTIEGIIDSNAKTLNIGAFAQDNGDFYFDDFKLEVTNGKSKKWTEIALKNSDFEENLMSNDWREGISKDKKHIKNFTVQTSENNPFSGKKSLLIKGENIIGNMPHGKFAEVNGIKM